ncbi:class I SAM-dependent methyltransferase [Roseateles sp. MS654]|uniref:class I SAM-dependent methyltransferase n=1 Tax=Roseateles sp. MS654 TaxID=3412685 RepID=UPI003C2D40FB
MKTPGQDDDTDEKRPIVEAHVRPDTAAAELAHWLRTPAGHYLLAWEQRFIDAAVIDWFGYHAVQLGFPQLHGLRTNRMTNRWLALDHLPFEDTMAGPPMPGLTAHPLEYQPEPHAEPAPGWNGAGRAAVYCEFDALPFESNSLDLVLLPHTLEQAADPHRCLREVERVLRPEGRVVILGLNPASLWAVRQNLARVNGRLLGRPPRLYLPEEREYIGYWRLRDWLRLLSFEVERAQFGCYRPPLLSDPWLARWQWIEKPGGKWWTVLGALYGVIAIKRVHGMRLIGLAARGKQRVAKTAPAVAAVHHHHHHRDDVEVE